MTDPDSLEKAANELRLAITELRATIGEANQIRAELNEAIQRGKLNSKMIFLVGAGFVLDVILTFVVAFLSYQLNGVVEYQRDVALCPVYKLFLEADTPQNAERARQQGQDMDTRAEAFAVIRNSYRAIGCNDAG